MGWTARGAPTLSLWHVSCAREAHSVKVRLNAVSLTSLAVTLYLPEWSIQPHRRLTLQPTSRSDRPGETAVPIRHWISVPTPAATRSLCLTQQTVGRLGPNMHRAEVEEHVSTTPPAA